MSFTYQSNYFIDLYRDIDGTLHFLESVVIDSGKLNIIVDTVSPQNSKIEMQVISDIRIGDYGVLRSNGKSFVFLVNTITDKKDEDLLEISCSFGVDILRLENICERAKSVGYKSPFFERKDDLVELFNTDLHFYQEKCFSNFCYYFVGWTGSVVVEYGQEGLKTHSQIIREKSRTNNVSANINIVQHNFSDFVEASGYKIEISLSQKSETPIDLNLDDVNVFDSYNVGTSNSQYNLLMLARASSYSTIVRVDTDGNIQEPYNADLSVNPLFKEKAIYPVMIKNIVYDPSTGNAPSYQSARDKLLEQHFATNIEATLRLDNTKFTLNNFDDIFAIRFNLWRNGEKVNTVCTRYEWDGGNLLKLKFGNVRGRLTEKLQKLF